MKPQLRIFALAVIFILLVPMIMACGGAAPAAEEAAVEEAEPEQAAEAESTEAEATSAYNEALCWPRWSPTASCRRWMSGSRQSRR